MKDDRASALENHVCVCELVFFFFFGSIRSNSPEVRCSAEQNPTQLQEGSVRGRGLMG